ncbi:MAG: hypothetical protein JSU89_15780 [Myxococcales bacterium]|nr:MAG: hypothetical protein JSU89_15780 [Myxococcales bacterium]
MRRKISIFLPADTLTLIDEVARTRLGVGRSAFLAVGGMCLAARFLAITPRPKRKQSLAALEALLSELRDRVEKAQ